MPALTWEERTKLNGQKGFAGGRVKREGHYVYVLSNKREGAEQSSDGEASLIICDGHSRVTTTCGNMREEARLVKESWEWCPECVRQ
jgi:hypothetical protein